MFFNRTPRPDRPKPDPKPIRPEAKKQFAVVVVMTIVLLLIYYGFIALGYTEAVMLVYMVAFAALLISYLVYNRGFVNKGVTEEMLPTDWSDDQKKAFVEGNIKRAEKSRWMLVFIIPFLFVFMAEALYLFVWDGWLSDFFKG